MPTTTAESPVETESPLSVLFADLDGELATTRRMLERVPNGHDDWRPHEKSRSLGQLATHLAQLPGFGMMMLKQDDFDGKTQRPDEPTLASSAERVKMFDELSAQLRSVLRQLTWDKARSTWTLRMGDNVILEAPRVNVFRTAFITHSAHHRAQVGVYLRLLDVSVPYSYGPSADEQPPGR
ncbi:MAG TPA: DinB family protein [Gemmatimonadaceae bacterium]